ncbi:MAG: uroporphyrinogen-III C-methyltransferase [Rhodospirillaceae bacterium]|jgi:uroporphyrin-III C-methyltransferase|nr:uroporphyrinogen-III C-methyltransferase [Rhodospirillaceae bacterium]MBT6117674.1 uroporphyrinogen-III C-methyltransferase [Rhodospirillaceae bacterium]
MQTQGEKPATVFLVGAGPGDPDLLTLRAARVLEAAEVVIHDRLISAAILDLVPEGAARVFVGKSAGRHAMPQAAINELLVRLARKGQRVVRLKGGDPFIFGRGSEEAEHLHRNGVPFEVVPGVTAASGCAAYAGIPLTHRGLASGVKLVTGHCKDDEELDLDWRSLADPDTTLVIYMGLANLPVLSARLIAAGLPGSTPAAAIASGTTPRQVVVRSTLKALPETVSALAVVPPVLFVIGRVVQLADVFAGDATEIPLAVREEPANRPEVVPFVARA